MKSQSELIHDAAIGLRQILFPGPVSQEAFIGDTNAWEAHMVAEAAQFTWNMARERARQECGTASAAAAVNSCERRAMAEVEMPIAGNRTKVNAMLSALGPELDAALAEVVQFTSDGTMEMNPDVWPEWVNANADLFAQMNTAFETEPLGNRILVVSYGRDGRTVASHMRRRPEPGDGLGGMLADESVAIFGGTDVQIKTGTKFGQHAAEPPPHTLTDVRFELVRLDERTPDGRLIHSDGFGVRDLPLSFSAMFTTAHGQPGTAEIVGSIDEVSVEEDGRVWGLGWLLNEKTARRAGRLLQAGALRGNSVELSASKVSLAMDEDDRLLQDYHEAKFVATTLVANPAMEDCTVALMQEDFDFGIEDTELSEMVEETLAAFTEAAPAVFTSAGVIDTTDAPSLSWFEDPKLTDPSPIRVKDGRVTGHVALWNQRHLGNRMGAPRSQTNYAYFATGEVETKEGTVATGRLVIGGEHAHVRSNWQTAIDFYAATSEAWADVAIGEDRHGIWVAGMVRPGVGERTLHAARASGVSGDWRRIGGNLELVAILSVNTPAFPVPRAFQQDGRAWSMVGLGNQPAPTIGLMQQLPEDVTVLADMARKSIANEIASGLRKEMVEEAQRISREV